MPQDGIFCLLGGTNVLTPVSFSLILRTAIAVLGGRRQFSPPIRPPMPAAEP